MFILFWGRSIFLGVGRPLFIFFLSEGTQECVVFCCRLRETRHATSLHLIIVSSTNASFRT